MLKGAFVIAVLAILAAAPSRAGDTLVPWQPWSNDVFKRAQAEDKLVLLGLEAVWCHWCHVMDATTYRDPKVLELIDAHFIPVRVDQDSRPDIANRYQRWGWPATVIFLPDGREMQKLRGYYRPEVFALILEAAVIDPTPREDGAEIPEAARSHVSHLPEARRAALDRTIRHAYDRANAGWGKVHKFLDLETLAYALDLAKAGDAEMARMARATIDKSLLLVDPVWGGAYQYSDTLDWRSPHFEKIMAIQAAYLQTYAAAYALWGDPAHRRAADDIYRYLRDFLLAENGAFYTSQDADLDAAVDGHAYFPLDDAGRRALGLPRIDTHQYARENGRAIAALAAYHDATGEHAALDIAVGAARWVLAHRALEGGGFRHDARDDSGPYLGDSLSMAQAFVDLYKSTGDRAWLQHARQAAEFIRGRFVDATTGGLFTAVPDPDSPLGPPVKEARENVTAARLFNLLAYYAGDKAYRRVAEAGMGYLAAPARLDAQPFQPGVLLLDRELTHEPVHITVIGAKDDPAAAALRAAALAYPLSYKRAEWWDRREGPLPNHDVDYPETPDAAAFACTGNTCSLPVTDACALPAALDLLDRRLR
jgi:hypothetical protein